MSDIPAGHERRMVVRQLETWRQARGGNEDIPLKEALEHDFVEITPLSFVLNVTESADSPMVISMGAELIEVVGQDLTGQTISEIDDDSLMGHTLESLPFVLEKSVPVTNSNMYKNTSGEVVNFRSILLPLSSSSGDVNHILGAISFRKEKSAG